MKKFISSVMIVVLAFLLVSCGGGVDVKGEWHSAYMDTKEDGKIKMENFITLTFNDNGKCEMSAMGVSEEAEYKLDGNKVTFTMDGEESTATVDGDVLTMEQDGESMVFVRDLEKFDMPEDAKGMFEGK